MPKTVAIASTENLLMILQKISQQFTLKIEKENSNCVEVDVITSIDINNDID